MSVNVRMVLGRVGQDPKYMETANGNPKTSFSVATNNKWKTKSGDTKEETTWHNVVCWGNLADLTKQYLTKGRTVFVDGEHKVDTWEADGEKKRFEYILAKKIDFVGPAPKKESQDELGDW